jgi:hypothetical protein
MVIFLAGFVPGQGALPASRRVFHAPLTGHKSGDTDTNPEVLAKYALAQLAGANWQLAARSDRRRQFAASGGMRLGSEPVRARLKLMHQGALYVLSARPLFFWRLMPENVAPDFDRIPNRYRVRPGAKSKSALVRASPSGTSNLSASLCSALQSGTAAGKANPVGRD